MGTLRILEKGKMPNFDFLLIFGPSGGPLSPIGVGIILYDSNPCFYHIYDSLYGFLPIKPLKSLNSARKLKNN